MAWPLGHGWSRTRSAGAGSWHVLLSAAWRPAHRSDERRPASDPEQAAEG